MHFTFCHITTNVRQTNLAYGAMFHFVIVCERQNEDIRYRLTVPQQENSEHITHKSVTVQPARFSRVTPS